MFEPMTVGELRQKLDGVSNETVVIMSRDGEGNSYSPASGYNTDYRFVSDGGWHGHLADPDECDDNCDHSDCEYGEGVPAFVLWPV